MFKNRHYYTAYFSTKGTDFTSVLIIMFEGINLRRTSVYNYSRTTIVYRVLFTESFFPNKAKCKLLPPVYIDSFLHVWSNKTLQCLHYCQWVFKQIQLGAVQSADAVKGADQRDHALMGLYKMLVVNSQETKLISVTIKPKGNFVKIFV